METCRYNLTHLRMDVEAGQTVRVDLGDGSARNVPICGPCLTDLKNDPTLTRSE